LAKILTEIEHNFKTEKNMMGIYIIFGVFALISWAVSANLQSKFKKYSKIPLSYGMTGREVAEKMLRDNGIYDVKVISTPGQLTDHYNPLTKTVNLSEGVYASNSVAAAAVAAHEADALGVDVDHGYQALDVVDADKRTKVAELKKKLAERSLFHPGFTGMSADSAFTALVEYWRQHPAV